MAQRLPALAQTQWASWQARGDDHPILAQIVALIAQRYQVSLASLRSPNQLRNDTIKVGQTLTVDKGAWAPEPAKLAVQWYRSGKAISKATKATYKLTKSDAKKKITVKVTAKKAGYETLAKTSNATGKVAK